MWQRTALVVNSPAGVGREPEKNWETKQTKKQKAFLYNSEKSKQPAHLRFPQTRLRKMEVKAGGEAAEAGF